MPLLVPCVEVRGLGRARRLATLLATVCAGVSLCGCSYQDMQRPLVRNYLREAFPHHRQRPPELPLARVESASELAEALRRWQHLAGAQAAAYAVGPGDVLRVTLFVGEAPEETLQLELRVSEQGTVRCPLLGEVAVGGLTSAQCEEKLTRLYADGYYRAPTVSVSVSEYNSRRIFVSGQVAKPGPVALRSGRTTLLEALLEAGG